MKIGVIIAHVGAGGDWVIARTLLREHLKRGHAVYLAANNFDPSTESKELTHIPIRINEGKGGVFNSLKTAQDFPEDLDVLHAHSPNALMFALWVKRVRCRQAKIVMTFHWPVEDTPMRLRFKRFLFNRADCIHCYSIDTQTDLCERYGIEKTQQALIYVGLDTNPYVWVDAEERKAFRKQFSLPDEAKVIGFAGRLNPEKNVHYLVEYVKHAEQQGQHVHALIAGDGPCLDTVQGLAKELNVVDRVTFLGRVNGLRPYYGAIDLLVLPSTFEAFGLVVMEAGLCGTPTLRSDVQGAVDQIEDGVNGFVFPLAEGIEGQNSKLDAIFNDHFQRFSEIGKASREKALDICNLEVCLDQLEARFAN